MIQFPIMKENPDGALILTGMGRAIAMFNEARQCPCCKRMTYFAVNSLNTYGRSVCVHCDKHQTQEYPHINCKN